MCFLLPTLCGSCLVGRILDDGLIDLVTIDLEHVLRKANIAKMSQKLLNLRWLALQKPLVHLCSGWRGRIVKAYGLIYEEFFGRATCVAGIPTFLFEIDRALVWRSQIWIHASCSSCNGWVLPENSLSDCFSQDYLVDKNHICNLNREILMSRSIKLVKGD